MDSREREEILIREMKPWLDKDYRPQSPQSVTVNSAYLVKQRKINGWWLLAWTLIIPVIGGAFYILYVYYGELNTVSITVGAYGRVWVQRSRTR